MTNYFEDDKNREKMESACVSWLGTPYLHMGEGKGLGVDCTKLTGLILIEAGLVSTFDRNYYEPDWYDHRADDFLISTLRTNLEKYCSIPYILRPYETNEILKFGDVLGFCMNKGIPVQTAGEIDPCGGSGSIQKKSKSFH